MPTFPLSGNALTSLVTRELLALRVPPNLLGFSYLIYAIEQLVENPQRIRRLTQDLYCDIANHYCTSIAAVERNIRTAISISWTRNGAEYFSVMASYRVTDQPWPSEFLAIVSTFIRFARDS